MKTKAVLQELFDLLEAYAPAWYTEEQHHRAVAALQQAKPGLQLVRPSSEPGTAESAPSRAKTDTGAYLQ